MVESKIGDEVGHAVHGVVAHVPNGDEALARVRLDRLVLPVEASHLAQHLLDAELVEILVEYFAHVALDGRERLTLGLLVLGRIAVVEGVVDHDRVAAVERDGSGRLLAHENVEEQLDLDVRLGVAVHEAAGAVEERAEHLDVVVAEVGEQRLEAVDGVRFGEHAELDELADEAGRLYLGLDVHLVLLAHVVAEVAGDERGELGGQLADARLQDGHEARVEGQQVEASARHLRQRLHQPLAVELRVQREQEVLGRLVDELPVNARRQLYAILWVETKVTLNVFKIFVLT